MNNIIAEKNKKRYLPHDVNTRKWIGYNNLDKKDKDML